MTMLFLESIRRHLFYFQEPCLRCVIATIAYVFSTNTSCKCNVLDHLIACQKMFKLEYEKGNTFKLSKVFSIVFQMASFKKYCSIQIYSYQMLVRCSKRHLYHMLFLEMTFFVSFTSLHIVSHPPNNLCLRYRDNTIGCWLKEDAKFKTQSNITIQTIAVFVR